MFPDSIFAADEAFITTDLDRNAAGGQMSRRQRYAPSLQVFAVIGVHYKSELIALPQYRHQPGPGGSRKRVPFRLTGASYVSLCLESIRNDRRCELNDEHREAWFLQDRAACHESAEAQHFIRTIARWRSLDWDHLGLRQVVTPMEYVYRDLRREVSRLGPKTRAELRAAAVMAWRRIPQRRIDRYVRDWCRAIVHQLQE